eukprot:764147-Hanusia_phi.AAC.4
MLTTRRTGRARRRSELTQSCRTVAARASGQIGPAAARSSQTSHAAQKEPDRMVDQIPYSRRAMEVGDLVTKKKGKDQGMTGRIQEVVKSETGEIKLKVNRTAGGVWKLQSACNFERTAATVNEAGKSMPWFDVNTNQAFPDEFRLWIYGLQKFESEEKRNYESIWFILGKYDRLEESTIEFCWNASKLDEKDQKAMDLPLHFYPKDISGGEWIPKEFCDSFKLDMWDNIIAKDSICNSICYFELDHLFPRSRGGKTLRENLTIIHWNANRKKSDKLIPFLSEKEVTDLQAGLSLDQFLSLTKYVEENFHDRVAGYAKLKKMLTENLEWPKNIFCKLRRLTTGRDLWMYMSKRLEQYTLMVQEHNQKK